LEFCAARRFLTAPARYTYHSDMPVLLFLRDLALATLGQMATLFAGIFIFGLLINFLSQFSFKALEKAFGSSGIYLVAWLGTPIHELGHALFCLIFFHKIEDIKFFKPDKVNGTLGYVYHTWNTKNLWHVLGNFFIGVGPMVLGSAVLFGVFYLLIPGSSQLWSTILDQAREIEGNSIGSYFQVWSDSALALVKLIFTWENLGGWHFWVFLYLAICISANIRLSWSDFKHTLRGLVYFVLLFFLFNLILLLISSGSEAVLTFVAASLGAVYGVLMLALVMALIGFVIIYAVSALYYRMRYRIFLKPF
jgi:hypothetical protein